MALTYRGFDTASGFAIETEGEWALLNHRAGKLLNNSEGIVSGGTLTAVSGARRLSVDAFSGLLPGLLVDNDGPLQTPLHDAQPSGSGTRIDYLTLAADWSLNQVFFEVVKGASATTPPSLGTQTIGGRYRMPYARVKVLPGASSFNVATDIERCYPVPRLPIYLRATSFTARTLAAGGAGGGVATLTHVDPGWPYRVEFSATHTFGTALTTSSDYGQGVVLVLVDGNEVARDRTPTITGSSGQYTVTVVGSTTVRTGPVSVANQLAAVGMSIRNDANDLANRFEVRLIPAI